MISIHALLAESDPVRTSLCVLTPYFYPRSPCGERHQREHAVGKQRRISIHALLAESDYAFRLEILAPSRFLSTLSLRRATAQIIAFFIHIIISIHALLAESDAQRTALVQAFLSISIHALLAESDHILFILFHTFKNFYPRSPCGERLELFFHGCIAFLISIHALLAESDRISPGRMPVST